MDCWGFLFVYRGERGRGSFVFVFWQHTKVYFTLPFVNFHCEQFWLFSQWTTICHWVHLPSTPMPNFYQSSAHSMVIVHNFIMHGNHAVTQILFISTQSGHFTLKEGGGEGWGWVGSQFPMHALRTHQTIVSVHSCMQEAPIVLDKHSY